MKRLLILLSVLLLVVFAATACKDVPDDTVPGPGTTDPAGTTSTPDDTDPIVPPDTQPHVHTEVEIPAVAATCTSTGLTAGKKCSECGEITEPQTIVSMKEHTPEVVPGKEATCAVTGKTAGSKCSVCDTVLDAGKTIPKTDDHSFKSFGADCSVCGTDYVTLGLDFVEIQDGAGYQVSGMGKATDETVIIPATYGGKPVLSIGAGAFQGKKIKSITIPEGVTEIGIMAFWNCTELTYVYIPKTMKTFGMNAFRGTDKLKDFTYDGTQAEWDAISKDATWDSGKDQYDVVKPGTSTACKHTNIVTVEAKAATCAAAGNTAGKKCKDCGATIEGNTVIPATGYHNYVNGKCSACGKTEPVVHTHVWESVEAKEATCSEAGYTAHKKCECGDTDGKKSIAKKNHTFTGNSNTCSVCGTTVDSGTAGLTYTAIEEGKAYALTGASSSVSGTVNIAAYYNGKPVTAIRAGAFDGAGAVTKIIIPESVDSIAAGAFKGCVVTIEVASDNEVYKVINGNLMTGTTLVLGSGGTIPDGTKTIASYAFEGSAKTKLSVPTSVTEIKSNAFADSSIVKLEYAGTEAKWKSDVTKTGVTSGITVTFKSSGTTTPDPTPEPTPGLEFELDETTKSFYTVVGIGTLGSSKDIVIPETYKDLPVTAIAKRAFNGITSVKTITIPFSVTNIAADAIVLPNLTTINYDGTEADWKKVTKVEDWCGNFDADKVTFLKKATTTLTVDSDGILTGIGEAKGDIIIPESIVLEEGEDPVTIVGIKIGAFAKSGITSVTLPGTIKNIASGAFLGCTDLEKIIFKGAFSAWEQVTKGDGWDMNTGNYTLWVAEGAVEKEHLEIDTNGIITGIGTIPADIAELEIPTSYLGTAIKGIASNAFDALTSKAVTLVYKGTAADWSALSGYADIEKIEKITVKVTDGGKLYTLEALRLDYEEVKGGIAVSGIGTYGSATTITIPTTYYGKAVVGINYTGFSNVEKFIFAGTEKQWMELTNAQNWDSGLDDYTIEVTEGGSKYEIRRYRLEYTLEKGTYTVTGLGTMPKNAKDITILAEYKGKKVTEIAADAFKDSEIEKITVSQYISSIDPTAFTGCSELSSIEVVPANRNYFTDDGNCIIDNNYKLVVGCMSTKIPDTATSIGANAYISCTEITSITIPTQITKIEASAFSGINLKEDAATFAITYEGTEEEWKKIDGAWNANLGNYNLKVTEEDGIAYTVSKQRLGYELSADGKSYIVTGLGTLPADTASITIDATYLGKPVIAISANAFKDNGKITTVTISDSVTEIGANAFSGCADLTTVDLGDGIVTIGNSAFNGCSDLTAITLPDALETIGASAFAGTGLTAVTIPAKVEAIGISAFADSLSLGEITIEAAEFTMGKDAFNNCGKNITVDYLMGEKADWEDIVKDVNWTDAKAYTIKCSDGNISYPAE